MGNSMEKKTNPSLEGLWKIRNVDHTTVGNNRGGSSGKKKDTNLKEVRAELPTFVCTFPIYS